MTYSIPTESAVLKREASFVQAAKRMLTEAQYLAIWQEVDSGRVAEVEQ